MKLSGMRSHYIIPLKDAKVNVKNLLTPNPRTVSQVLLKRDKFIPATILNLHAFRVVHSHGFQPWGKLN